MKLVSTAEMQKVEQEADSNGLTYEIMMEQAGQGLAEKVSTRYASLKEGGVLGLVGSGNNGGDTLVALAKMAEEGWSATAYIVRPRSKDDPLVERVISCGGSLIDGAKDDGFKQLISAIGENSVIMDGILGTGIKLPLRGKVKEALGTAQQSIAEVNNQPVLVAVDCPSGVDCDTGDAAQECLHADLTVTMAAAKQGLFRFPANNLIGELVLVGIGLDEHDERAPTWNEIQRQVVTAGQVKDLLPPRPRDAHKGTFGTALIVGGSVNYTGAALLSGKAAYLAGVGLVTMGVPIPLHSALAGEFPEGTWLLLTHEMGVIADAAAEIVLENLGNASALLIGPGFGQEDTTKRFTEKLFSKSKTSKATRLGFVSAQNQEQREEKTKLPPLVIDADGLKLLSKLENWAQLIAETAVLTPHPGEMAVLTGLDVKKIQEERVAVAEEHAAAWGHVIVLKGANTVVAEPGGRTALVPIASPALARAGTGDVLAGLITGLRAQGMQAFESALCGAWIHAQSGLLAASRLGTNRSVLAGDLLDALPDVFRQLEE